jgi:hypothetical protein
MRSFRPVGKRCTRRGSPAAQTHPSLPWTRRVTSEVPFVEFRFRQDETADQASTESATNGLIGGLLEKEREFYSTEL